MSGADKFMPTYWGDYLKDTGHLSAAEHGAYLLLIGHYWTTGHPLPDVDEALRRVARMEPKEWRRCRDTIRAFFQVGDGVWRHKRIEAELERAAAVYEKRSEAARKRWAKSSGGACADANGHANASAGHEQPQPQPQPQNQTPPSQTPTRAPERDPAVAAMVAVLDDAVREHFPLPRPSKHRSDDAIAKGWVERGVTVEQAQAVIEPMVGKAAANGDEAPFSLKYFLNAMERAIAAGRAGGGVVVASLPSDPAQEAAARAFNDATRAWADNGREGPPPKPEQFGWKPRKVAA